MNLRPMKLLTIFIVIMLLDWSTAHQFRCVFDEENIDLTANAYLSKPARLEPNVNQGRLLAIAPLRVPMRIHLDTSAFNTVNSGTNGAATTTTTNLNFILKTMLVAQVFYQNRLQVAQTANIYSPATCVDFTTSSTDQKSGFSNKDLVIYVQYVTDTKLSYGATGKSCNYFPGTATAISPDNTLSVGRPTVGRIRFNTYNLVDQYSLTNVLFQSVTATALHETMHILGFDSTLYDSYIDPSKGYKYSTPKIVNSATVNAQRPKTSLLATPFVTAWAQNFFGCNSLLGMLLENQDATGSGAGSHWQRTAMYDQLMTGTSYGAVKGMSGLTFALLKDMGWYNVDDTFSQTTNYGYQKGCSFVLDACYSSTSFPVFCNAVTQLNISYCETTFFSKAICSNNASMMADGCGLYGPYFNCVDTNSTDEGYQSQSSEVYGTNSFCVTSTLGSVTLPSNLLSRCYPYVCGTSSIVFTVGSYTITCLSSEAGVQKTLSARTGYLTCPVFADFCTLSRKTCTNWCNQNGFCMNGVCNCYTGYYGSDCYQTSCDSTTYYDAASSKCVLNCPSGTYQNIYSRSCLACQAPCQQCITLPTNCLNCLSSVNNIQYYYNGACSSTCPAGTFASGYVCLVCDTSVKCATCIGSASLCTSCLGGLYLSQQGNGSCIVTCVGTSNFLLDKVNSVCVASCPSNMIAPGDGTCVLCSSGYSYQGSCLAICPDKYYADSIQKSCLKCDSSCLTCVGSYPQNCTSCALTLGAPYLLLKMCWSICPKGFYANSNTNKCQICTYTLNCMTCAYNPTSTTVYCTSCAYGTFYQSATNTCGVSCLSTQYKSAWNNSCTSCDPACLQCNGPSNTSCTACLSTQKLLTNSSGGYCLASCPVVGYVAFGTTCQTCDSTCSSCNGANAGQCSNCLKGYYYYSGYCRYICPGGTYPNSTTSSCLACDASCTYCFGASSSSCTTCVSGLYLFNYTCTSNCPASMAPNKWNVCFDSWVVLGALFFVILGCI